MLKDRYDNPLTTTNAAARDAYVDGVDRFLAALPGVEDALERAVAEEPGFALAHLALARQHQMKARPDDVAASLAAARAASVSTSREAAHIDALGDLLEGRGGAAYPKIRAHLNDHPRDAMIAQTCIGVFGLIGFSGQNGREAEQLAFTTSLMPHYGDDWWMLGGHGFAQLEIGQLGPAEASLERSLTLMPRNGNSAHYRAHLHYENGETDAGYKYMRDWMADYDRAGVLHTHIAWHIALWALEQGDGATLWSVVEADIAPGAATGPPINVLTDCSAILFRAELAGEAPPEGLWRGVSDYAAGMFPKAGIAFADLHAALAHAMAGNGDALARLIAEAKGPAGDLVCACGEAFGAMASGRWAEAVAHLAPAMAEHERLGGSRAQRDMLEFAYAAALLRDGKAEEARRALATRRPRSTPKNAVKGLAAA